MEMRKRQRTLLTVFCLSAFVAASAIGKDINGQIFIVTAGAQAIKLPLVQVGAISKADLEKHVSEIESQTAPEHAKADSAVTESTEEFQNAKRAVAGGFGKWMMTLQKTQSKDPTGKPWADPRTEALRFKPSNNVFRNFKHA
jgi:hypothetical protein